MKDGRLDVNHVNPFSGVHPILHCFHLGARDTERLSWVLRQFLARPDFDLNTRVTNHRTIKLYPRLTEGDGYANMTLLGAVLLWFGSLKRRVAVEIAENFFEIQETPGAPTTAQYALALPVIQLVCEAIETAAINSRLEQDLADKRDTATALATFLPPQVWLSQKLVQNTPRNKDYSVL